MTLYPHGANLLTYVSCLMLYNNGQVYDLYGDSLVLMPTIQGEVLVVL